MNLVENDGASATGLQLGRTATWPRQSQSAGSSVSGGPAGSTAALKVAVQVESTAAAAVPTAANSSWEQISVDVEVVDASRAVQIERCVFIGDR